MNATPKQIQYLVYKLQDFAIVPTDRSIDMYWTYVNMTRPESVKRVSDIWERAFNKRIEHLDKKEVESILEIFTPSSFSTNQAKRKRLAKKLSKFIKE
jgi:hypothetical protein